MPILFDPTTGHRRDKGREKSVNRQRKDCSILIRSVGGMRRRSTNQVLSGLFSTSSDKEIRSKFLFRIIDGIRRKDCRHPGGHPGSCRLPSGWRLCRNQEQRKICHLQSLAPRRSAGPCHNLGAPAWSTHLRSFSPRKPAGPVRALPQPGSTSLEHSPAAPSCPAVQVPIKPLTQTSVQVSTFQVSSF